MTDTEKQVDALARIIFGGLYAILPATARDRFADQRAPWRTDVVLAAAEAALPEVLRNTDFAAVLAPRE